MKEKGSASALAFPRASRELKNASAHQAPLCFMAHGSIAIIKEIFMDTEFSLSLSLLSRLLSLSLSPPLPLSLCGISSSYLEDVSSRALGEHMNLPAPVHLGAHSQDKRASC